MKTFNFTYMPAPYSWERYVINASSESEAIQILQGETTTPVEKFTIKEYIGPGAIHSDLY